MRYVTLPASFHAIEVSATLEGQREFECGLETKSGKSRSLVLTVRSVRLNLFASCLWLAGCRRD
jgi:hypothetical protein